MPDTTVVEIGHEGARYRHVTGDKVFSFPAALRRGGHVVGAAIVYRCQAMGERFACSTQAQTGLPAAAKVAPVVLPGSDHPRP